ncbi:MAG: tetratricopeptide (TPR) repeat protein [Saprospiraceae bacterium]|jgi:tetratricopeptide (TPR) repeat protein
MTVLKLINNKFTVVIVLLLFAILATSFVFFSPDNQVAGESEKAYFKRSSICAPIGRIEREIECFMQPLAVKMEATWTNHMNISATEEAKVFFNQGMLQLYGFNHLEAEQSFKEGIRLDPDCAMCYWGVALSLGPNINVPMPDAQVEDAFKYTILAKEKSKLVSEKEKALILALRHRYVSVTLEDRSELDVAYAEEMKYIASRYREDLDVLTLYAESLMDLMPWNYWEEDNSPKPETREVQALLDYIIEKDPDHPGANHYYIHLTEAVHPKLALASADRLTELAYPFGHLIHMPSHIYIRVGRFNDALLANERAIIADEHYIMESNAQGVYPALYYPHNIHFLWFTAAMQGSSEKAIEASRKLDDKVPYAMAAAVPMIELFKPIEILTLLRFGKWDEVLETSAPDPGFLYSTNMWHYAWGMAFAKKGKLGKAKEQLAILEKGLHNEKLREQDDPQFPTILNTEIAINILNAEINGQEGRGDKKVEFLTKAVTAQDELIYMEPPLFYYEVRQSLGAALLKNEDFQKAEKVFKEELDEFPSNGWSLKGLHQSLIAQGKMDQASKIEKEFEEAWKYADVQLENAVF